MAQDKYRIEMRMVFYIIILFAIISIGGIFLGGYKWPFGFIVWLMLTAVAVFILVRYHSRHTTYTCPECHENFPVSTWTDLISPHKSDEKYLRCPHCHKRNWCRESEQ
jgi:MerR family transcriptional regulator, thiopeptide resistance regulator